MSRLRSWLAASLSLTLASGGCSKTEEAPPAQGAPTTPAGEAPKAGEAPEAGTPPAPAPTPAPAPAGEGSLATTVAAMIETETSYPAALDPLLDLVPAGSPVMVVVRDLDDLLALTSTTLGALDAPMRAMAKAAGGDASTEVAQVLDGHRTLKAAFGGPDLTVDAGLVVASVGGKGVVIYGTSKPDALPTLLRSMGAEGDDMPDECKAVDGVAGYGVCAADAATLAAYAPGKAAAALRATLSERLGSRAVERANVLAHVAQDPSPSDHVTFAVATTPGLVHFTAGLTRAPDELGRFLGTGPSPSLGLLAPGSGFYWGKLDPAALAASPTASEPFVGNVIKTLTGEMMLGALADPSAVVMLAGVTDPAPAAGLVALAGMQAGSLPKTLPDGTGLEVAMETLTVAGKSAQALHATLTPKGEQAELFKTMGIAPEGWLFSAGGYAGVVFGAGKGAVEKIAAHPGSGMSPEAVRMLPKPLAEGLVDGEVALAIHLPIDGLQSPRMIETFEKVAAQIPTDDLPPGVSPAQVMSLARAAIAPVSGLSVWMAPPKDRFTIDVALSLLGDARTEEGKAVLDAMTRVAAGGDAAAAWGELATRFPTSDRLVAYQARAGTRADASLASVAVLGVLGAAAAFSLFATRSVAAAPMVGYMEEPAPSPMVAAPPAVPR